MTAKILNFNSKISKCKHLTYVNTKQLIQICLHTGVSSPDVTSDYHFLQEALNGRLQKFPVYDTYTQIYFSKMRVF